MSPLTPRQMGKDFSIGEKYIELLVSGVSADQYKGVIITDAAKIVVTEVGAQASTFTGSSPTLDLQVRTLDALTTGADTSGTGTDRYTTDPSAHQLTAAGVVCNRPFGGVVTITSSMMNTLSDGRPAVILQLHAVEGGTITDWTGRMWMRWVEYPR